MPIKFYKHIQCLGIWCLAAPDKSDGAVRNGNIQGQLHEGTVIQFLFHEVLDDAAGAETDPGKINEQIHGGGFQEVVWLDVLLPEIIINIGTGYIALLQHEDGTIFEYIRLGGTLTEPHVGQISGGGDEAVLNFHNLLKNDVLTRRHFSDEPQVDLLMLKKLHGLEGGLAVDREFNMWITSHKFLQAGEEYIFTEHGADADADMSYAKLGHALQLVLAAIQKLECPLYMLKQDRALLCELDTAGIADEQRDLQTVLQLADREIFPVWATS